MATGATEETQQDARLRSVLIGMVCIAAAILLAERIWIAWAQPLWFDESWSLAVATTTDWGLWLHDTYNDSNGPLYYGLARLWRLIAGPSDFALRVPALIAVALAGAAPIMSRTPGLAFDARLTWGALVFAWWGADTFLGGRCYGLLLALSAFQTVAFAQLLHRPSLSRAWVWCGLGACAVLAQYYAIFCVATQGLIYLAARRGQAVRTWPALLAFVPMLAWIGWHFPRLRAFSDSAVTWHPLVDAQGAGAFTAFAINPGAPLVAGAVAAILAAAILFRRANDAAARDEAHLWLTALAAVAAFALILLSGVLRPTLTSRYFVPAAPGLMLGVVLLARRSSRPVPFYLMLAGLYFAVALRPDSLSAALVSRSPYGYELASQTLMAHQVSNVVFVWDHELAPVMDPGSLQRVGAVFFRRAGLSTPVVALVPRPAIDTNPLVMTAATGPRPGVIWLYNRAGRTSARTFPPRLPRIDPRWTCERNGDDAVGSLACYRTP